MFSVTSCSAKVKNDIEKINKNQYGDITNIII